MTVLQPDQTVGETPQDQAKDYQRPLNWDIFKFWPTKVTTLIEHRVFSCDSRVSDFYCGTKLLIKVNPN